MLLTKLTHNYKPTDHESTAYVEGFIEGVSCATQKTIPTFMGLDFSDDFSREDVFFDAGNQDGYYTKSGTQRPL